MTRVFSSNERRIGFVRCISLLCCCLSPPFLVVLLVFSDERAIMNGIIGNQNKLDPAMTEC